MLLLEPYWSNGSITLILLIVLRRYIKKATNPIANTNKMLIIIRPIVRPIYLLDAVDVSPPPKV